MKIDAVIEIPKGNNRRWHLNYAKTAIEDFGPIKEKIPVNDGVMPVAYGYLEGTKNESEKDEIDVLVFSNKKFEVGDRVNVRIFGCIKRSDGDDKILAHDDTTSFESWEDVSPKDKKLILEYFGYNHHIESVEEVAIAEAYVNKSLI